MSTEAATIDAEIEIVEMLRKHARALRHNRGPLMVIAAARQELALDEQLQSLKERRNHTDTQEVAAHAGGSDQ